MCLLTAASLENMPAAPASASLSQVEASVQDWLLDSHRAGGSEDDTVAGQLGGCWESEWGSNLEVEESSYWMFIGDGDCGDKNSKDKRRNAFDSGMARPPLADEFASCNLLVSKNKNSTRRNRSALWGMVRRIGLIGVAALGAATLTA